MATSTTQKTSSGRQIIVTLVTLGITIAVAFGVGFLMNFFEVNSKIDLTIYPAASRVELTEKGQKFVQGSYLSTKKAVSTDYYKVLATPDQCATVLEFYKTDAVAKGYQFKSEGRLLGSDTLALSFTKDKKDLIVNCSPASEGYIKNSTNNAVIILAGN